jgi:hypothetical protein
VKATLKYLAGGPCILGVAVGLTPFSVPGAMKV